MTTLFKRKYRVVVDTIEITELDLSFRIEKSLKPEPNTCELTIVNLNRDQRSSLEELTEVPVSVEAGYDNGAALLFLGKLRRAVSVHEGPDVLTSISSGDGEKEYRTARVNVPVAKGTSLDVVVKKLVEAIGIGKGNVDLATVGMKFAKTGELLSAGSVLSGNPARELTNLLRSVGFTWSIQNGTAQILGKDEALKATAILATPETGLIGSPTVDNKGILSARLLMIPDVAPGRLMVLKAERNSGNYRIEKCTYIGDTAGQDWYIDVEAKRF